MTSANPATRLSRPWPRRDTLLLLFLGASLPFFFISGPAWLNGELGRALANLGHIPFFALLTLLAHSHFPLNRVRRCLGFSLAVFGLSLVLEWTQAQVGRSASWDDVLRNLTGTWLAIVWLQKPYLLVWAGRGAVMSLLALDLGSLISIASAEYRIAKQLPLIAGFEHKDRAERWGKLASQIERIKRHASQGSYSLGVQLGTASYSGLALTRIARNWSEYERLDFDLFNSGNEGFAMTLRIHDARHESGERRWQYNDRFNKRIHVQPGWNHYSVDLNEVANAPKGRKMDMSAIRDLSLFAVKLDEPEVIHVDNFRLR